MAVEGRGVAQRRGGCWSGALHHQRLFADGKGQTVFLAVQTPGYGKIGKVPSQGSLLFVFTSKASHESLDYIEAERELRVKFALCG